MTTSEPALSIGEVAERTGLSIDTLRFYERENLLVSPVQRTAGGRRRYTQTDVDWLTICTKLRATGMPLTGMHEFAALVRQGPGNEAQRLSILRTHQARVEAQLAELTDCLNLINWKVGVYAEQVDAGTACGVWDGTPDRASPATTPDVTASHEA